jgi:hypothetical protein
MVSKQTKNIWMNIILENTSYQCHIFTTLEFKESRIFAWHFLFCSSVESPSSSDSYVENLNSEVKVENRNITKDVGCSPAATACIIAARNQPSFVRLLNFVSIPFLVYYFLFVCVRFLLILSYCMYHIDL